MAKTITDLIDAELEDMARLMAAAYPRNLNRENAVIEVLHKYPDAPVNVLRAMWEAIDSYVDIWNIGAPT